MKTFGIRNIMKKTTQTLVLVLSVLLLLVFVTASPRARSNPDSLPPQLFEAKAQVRWKKDMGRIPIGPGKILASNGCSPFFFVAYAASNGDGTPYSETKKIFAHSSRSTSQPTEQEGYYVCDYSFQVPLHESMELLAWIGDVDLLPKINRQPYYLTDPWIGGTNSRPPAGWERGLVDRPSGSTRYLEFSVFEMVYRPSDHSKTTSDTSDIGASPLLSRVYNFAGAWQGKWGEGGLLELILQQTGKQVAGRFRINSAELGLIKEGIVDGNTLRFKLFRPNINPLAGRPDEYLGLGELVMDADLKSFTGTILGTDTSGTLIGR